MKDNYMKFKYFINKQRKTKFSNNYEDVDTWLADMGFDLFGFCNEMCYKRYFVYNRVQYAISLTCFMEDRVTVYIRNCENSKKYECCVEFDENESRVIKLGEIFIESLNYFNINISDCNVFRIVNTQ